MYFLDNAPSRVLSPGMFATKCRKRLNMYAFLQNYNLKCQWVGHEITIASTIALHLPKPRLVELHGVL